MLEITDYVLYTVLKENKNKLNDLLKTIIINYSKSREELFVFIEDLIKQKVVTENEVRKNIADIARYCI